MGCAPDQTADKYAKAAEWFLKAAAQGNAEAMYCLASYQSLGLAGLGKSEPSSQLLSTSFDHLCLSSPTDLSVVGLDIHTLGELIQYSADDLLLRDFDLQNVNEIREKLALKRLFLKGESWQTMAAAGRQIDAMYELGLNWRQTAEELEKVASNDPPANPALGAKLDREVGWLAFAAVKGHVEARLEVVRSLLHNLLDLNPAFGQMFQSALGHHSETDDGECRLVRWQLKQGKTSLDWCAELAAKGNGEANFLLGRCYEQGIKELLDPNRDEAIRCYRIAAEAGHAEAQYRLSECVRRKIWGKVANEDDDLEVIVERQPELAAHANEAIKWCMLAANGGHADAQYRLGDSLWRDEESEDCLPLLRQEQHDGVCWICKAALQGHSEAVGVLTGAVGRLFDDDGDTFFWDYPVAWETLHVLAKNRNGAAAFLLAQIYSLAHVRMRDYGKAKHWLHEAADCGHQEAVELVLQGLQRVRACDCEANACDDTGFGEEVFEDLDEVEEHFQVLEDRRKSEDIARLAWDYLRLAELEHQGAAERLAEMGEAGTKAIIDALRPVHQQSPPTL